MLRIEQERQALQQRLADMDRDTQLRLAELRTEGETQAATRERYSFWTFVVLAVVGVGLALLSVGASLYPDDMRRLIDSIAGWLAQWTT